MKPLCKHKAGKIIHGYPVGSNKHKVTFKCKDCGRLISKEVTSDKLHKIEFIPEKANAGSKF